MPTEKKCCGNRLEPDGNGGSRYKGYTIRMSQGGGKAGRGRNYTATLQVHELQANGTMILKQYVFIVGNRASFDRAEAKCIAWIDEHCYSPKQQEVKDAD